MKSKDIKTSLELLHRRILNNSKFCEEVTEPEIMAIVDVINILTDFEGITECENCKFYSHYSCALFGEPMWEYDFCSRGKEKDKLN